MTLPPKQRRAIALIVVLGALAAAGLWFGMGARQAPTSEAEAAPAPAATGQAEAPHAET